MRAFVGRGRRTDGRSPCGVVDDVLLERRVTSCAGRHCLTERGEYSDHIAAMGGVADCVCLSMESDREVREPRSAGPHARSRESATDEKRQRYESQLADLPQKLLAAEEKNRRALSMAQQTKTGHVYVISNIGSFGEDVFKIFSTLSRMRTPISPTFFEMVRGSSLVIERSQGSSKAPPATAPRHPMQKAASRVES
ncbi:MAG TPA: hypothetical protein VJT73_02400 [Polyangiaceae bacterium]|nr:hypothetical protein [Polyangiaceae bacterium]